MHANENKHLIMPPPPPPFALPNIISIRQALTLGGQLSKILYCVAQTTRLIQLEPILRPLKQTFSENMHSFAWLSFVVKTGKSNET